MVQPLPYESEASEQTPLILHPTDGIGVQIPPRLTSFVGRDREIQEVTALLKQPGIRLVTITGPGGVGKTSLAFQVASNLSTDFTDGVALVDMSAVTSPSLVAPTFALALGMRESSERSLAERLADAFHGRKMLMVIDGFDYAVIASPLVTKILAGCPGIVGLITCREALNVSGEWNLPLRPLDLPEIDQLQEGVRDWDAVRLFDDRARAANPDFHVGDENIDVVVQVLGRLDGLPLAIELAAARIAHFPLVALLERLDRRLPLLTGGARDLPERQRTLRNTIAWSYDLLSPSEQALFRRLSVFVGGCSLEAAESIAGNVTEPNQAVFDEMASLVSKSLIRQKEDHAGMPRYRILETVREFGLEQLTEFDEDQSARDLHAAYFLDLVERADPAIWGGPDHAKWLDILEAEIDNFRAALAWLEVKEDASDFVRMAAALGGLWHYRSHRIEGRGWLSKALDAGEIRVPLARAMAFVKLSMLDRALGGANYVSLARQGLEIRQREGDQRGSGRAMVNLGNSLKGQEDYDQAAMYFQEAATLLDDVGDISGLASAHMFLGVMKLEQRDLESADSLLGEALALYRQSGFSFGLASVLLPLGRLEFARGNLAASAAYVSEGVRNWESIHSLEGLVQGFADTAFLALKTGQSTEATHLLGAAAEIGDALGYVASPSEQVRREETAFAAQKALGSERFSIAWDEGSQFSPGTATAEADQVLFNLQSPTPDNVTDISLLTSRELDVLKLLVEGQTDQEIAFELGLSYRTVTSYVRNILDKFNVSSRTAAATQAVRLGIV